MENEQERVLAYTLSTPISPRVLDEVSGGSGGGSHALSCEVTGSRRDNDVIFDA